MAKMIKNTLILLIIACLFIQSTGASYASGIAIKANLDALRPMATYMLNTMDSLDKASSADEKIKDVNPKLPNQPLSKRLVRKLRDSKQLLFYQKSPQANRGFISSDEHNIFNRAMDIRKAEIFIGAGSNSAWDFAVKRDTDIMVIWNIDEEVIIAQEYLYKPLILIADSPNEFISLLSGISLPKNMKNSPLEEVFRYINVASGQLLNKLPGQVEKSDRFIAEIEKRIKEHPQLNAQHALFVKRHLMYIRKLERLHGSGFYDHNIGEDNVFSYIMTQRDRDNPYRNFKRTYNPDWLIQSGAQYAQVTASNFSSFSSLESFAKLKKLFVEECVYYIIGDIFHRGGYEAIQALSKKTGLKVSGLSITNIIDSIAYKAEEKTMLKNKIISMVRSYLDTDNTFTLYQTLGTRNPYEYITFGVDCSVDDGLSGNAVKSFSESELRGINSLSESDKLILSIGISTMGNAEIEMARRLPSRKIIATTIYKDGITKVREKIDGSGIMKGQIQVKLEDIRDGKMPYDNSMFDFIYARMALPYLTKTELEHSLKEIYRVLKPGGKLYVAVRSVDDWEYKLPGAYTDKLTGQTTYPRTVHVDDALTISRTFFSNDSLAEYVLSASFEIIEPPRIFLENLFCDFARTIPVPEDSTLIDIVARKPKPKPEPHKEVILEHLPTMLENNAIKANRIIDLGSQNIIKAFAATA